MPETIAIIDPPYGVKVVKNNKVGGGNLCKTGTYKEIIGDETTETAKKAYQLLKDMGIDKMIIWGGNYFTDFLPPSPCWVVWDKKGDMESNNFADCEMAWTSFDTPARVFKCVWRGMIKQGEHDKRLHPTQKPIEMLVDVINKFTKEGDIVLDLFLGSGSTLIACEKTNRICYGMEIDPKYCDVVVKRWEEYTGQKAVKLNG